MSGPKWGVVATIKAPTEEVLKFAAYHLELGAAEVTICLDDCNAETASALNAHPKITAILTDDTYWKTNFGRRPKKHQVRQVRNASLQYRKSGGLDWLTHIDVDEFLHSNIGIANELAKIPARANQVRIAACESLCVDDQPDLDPEVTYCKARLPNGPDGMRLEQKFYPQFGGVLKSGFVSHVEGKIFVRTGLNDVKFGIHRAFEDHDKPIDDFKGTTLELCHKHVESWDKWLQIMEFRLKRGSYRAELETNLSPASGRIQRHQLFTSLLEGGTDDLRLFFEEVCLATPRLLQVLDADGCLRRYQLNLEANLAKHFPAFD